MQTLWGSRPIWIFRSIHSSILQLALRVKVAHWRLAKEAVDSNLANQRHAPAMSPLPLLEPRLLVSSRKALASELFVDGVGFQAFSQNPEILI